MTTFAKLINETLKRLYPTNAEIKKIAKTHKIFFDKLKESSHPKPTNEFKKEKGVLMVKIKVHPISKHQVERWVSVRRAVEMLYNGTTSRKNIRDGIMRGTLGLFEPIEL